MSSSSSFQPPEQNQNPAPPPAGGGGVRVIVRERPLPEPRRPRRPPAAGPQAIIVPAILPVDERDAVLASLCEEHGEYVWNRLLRYRNVVNVESLKDLRQQVLLVLLGHVEKRKPLTHTRGFLGGVIRNVVRNHVRPKVTEPAFDRGADVDALPASATDPEGKAARAERREKLGRFLCHLPPEEAQVVRARLFYGLTIEEAARAVGRPRATVARQDKRGMEKLEAMVLASERAAALAEDSRR